MRRGGGRAEVVVGRIAARHRRLKLGIRRQVAAGHVHAPARAVGIHRRVVVGAVDRHRHRITGRRIAADRTGHRHRTGRFARIHDVIRGDVVDRDGCACTGINTARIGSGSLVARSVANPCLSDITTCSQRHRHGNTVNTSRLHGRDQRLFNAGAVSDQDGDRIADRRVCRASNGWRDVVGVVRRIDGNRRRRRIDKVADRIVCTGTETVGISDRDIGNYLGARGQIGTVDLDRKTATGYRSAVIAAVDRQDNGITIYDITTHAATDQHSGGRSLGCIDDIVAGNREKRDIDDRWYRPKSSPGLAINTGNKKRVVGIHK